MSESFKTCVFGGFDKQDVINFIEQQAKTHQEELEALQRDNEVLKEAVQRMENERTEFLPKAQRQEDGEVQIERLEAQIAELAEQLNALRNENETLRVPAQEYYNLKDHIAEIEINAHHRTEEFRAETIRKIRDILNSLRAWCSEERGRYNCVNGEMLQKLRQATTMMETNNDAAFDRMMENLQQIEENLE